MNDKLLRFAPLVRVSTEGQEKMGESLRTQKMQIEQAVRVLGGTLIPDPWRYSGQEHSTPGFERKKFDDLLKDAGKDVFDAVIVCDPSRWSRDNVKSGQGLQILRENGIRFFTGQTEHDLYDPTSELFLGMATQINQYVAKISSQKSLRNRIERAKRGIPPVAKLPHGRTYDKKNGIWGIDQEKQKKIEWAAREYLKGEGIHKVAKQIGMAGQHLWTILNRRSGDTWELRFHSKRLNIDETISIKVPRLLDEETIRRIRGRAEANMTFNHGANYLLGRVIFCGECGKALTGSANVPEHRYYRHVAYGSCDERHWVRADEIEPAVMMHLFSTLGDQEGMERAMQKAIPDRERIEELRKKREVLEVELSKAEAKKQRLIGKIADGLISDEEAKRSLEEIRGRESSIRAEIQGIEPQLTDIPSEQEISRRAKMIQRIVSQIYSSPSRLKKMSFEERRKLVSTFFAGKDSTGKRLGVYVIKSKNAYEIRGAFNMIMRGNLNPEFSDFKNVRGEHLNLEYFDDLKEAAKGNADGYKQENLIRS